MKNALANIRAAVVAGDITLPDAVKECRKNGFSLDYPGDVLRLLHLPGRAERKKLIDTILRRAAWTVKHYYSDTEIDKDIINADTFAGVYAWAPRECGTNMVRIGTADGLPDDRGIEFFRACCHNWPGLEWSIIEAQGYDVHMYTKKNRAECEKHVNQRIEELREYAQAVADRAAVAV